MKQPKNKKFSSISLAKKNEKTSESMKVYHEKKRLEKQKIIEIEENLNQRVAAISSYRDALRTNFVGITADTCRVALDSTRSGYFLTWSDFCDYMMESDIQLSGMVSIRTHSITSKDLMIEAAERTPEAIKAADFVRSQIKQIKEFDRLIRQLLMGIFKGASAAEMVWDRNDDSGLFQISDIKCLNMKKLKVRLIPIEDNGDHYQTKLSTGYGDWIWSYWNYGDNGGYGEGIDLDFIPGKFLVFSPGDQIELQYRGLFRSVVKNWFYKQAGEAFWASGIEKYAFPVVYGVVDKTTPADARISLAEKINNLGNDASIVIPNNVSLQTIGTGTTGGDNAYKAFVEYHDSQMAKGILGSTLTIEGGKGSANRSNGEVGERTIEQLVYADAASLASMLRDQLVTYLLQYNLHLFDGVMPPVPNVWFDIETKDYVPLSQTDIDAGVVTKNEWRASRGLPLWTMEQGGEDIIKSALDSFSVGQPTTMSSIINGDSLNGANTAYDDLKKKKFSSDEIQLVNILKDKIDKVASIEEEGINNEEI